MRVFNASDYSREDYASAHNHHISTTVRPPHVDVEDACVKLEGDPSYVFWEQCRNGQVIAYAIPYPDLTLRRDNTIRAFGIEKDCRYYSVTPPGYSKVWKVVEDMGGTFKAWEGNKLYRLAGEIQDFSPTILQTPAGLIPRLIKLGVKLPALTRVMVVSGGCYEAEPSDMQMAHRAWGVPVFTFLSMAWAGPVTVTDGTSFRRDYVGTLLPKLDLRVDSEGFFCLRTAMTRRAQFYWQGKWHPMGEGFWRSSVRGRQDEKGFHVTERPLVAAPPQAIDL